MNAGSAADFAKKMRESVDPKMRMNMYPAPPRTRRDRESETPVEKPAKAALEKERFSVRPKGRAVDREFEEIERKLRKQC